MKSMISKFLRSWWLIALLGAMAIAFAASWYLQQPNDAKFTMPSAQPSVTDSPTPVQIKPVPAVSQPAAETDSLEPVQDQSTTPPAVAEQPKPEPTKSAAAQPPAVVVEPELDPVAVCSNDIEGVVIPSLDVSATTVPIGLDNNGVLGDPSHADRMAIGVYTAGSMPGEPGNTLVNGHTYNNGSSVFDHSFGTDLKVGDSIELVSGNCIYSYQVQRMWPHLAKHPSDVSDTAPLFSDVIDSQDLFRQQGPSGLVVMTCAGEFDYSIRHHQDEAVAYASLVDVTTI